MPRILVVCEGNICRSPYVEHALRAALPELGAHGVRIESAGTRARTGLPMVDRSAAALRDRGIEADEFRSRALHDVPALAAVDLVLTLERRHRADVLDLEPSILRRTFTLAEFARAAARMHCAAAVDAPAFPALVDSVRAARLPGTASDSDDVADPIRGDDSEHERFRARVAAPIAAISRLLAQA